MDTELTALGDDHGTRRLGTALAAARAQAGIDLTDIARDTRVPVRHLTAIENDAHDDLPALPYAVGFVKSFARAVGLDPDAAAAQFRAETSKTAHAPAAPTMAPLDERRLPPRGLLTLSILGVLAIVAAVVAYSAGLFDRRVPAEPQVAAAAPAETAPPPVQPTAAAPVPAIADAAVAPTTAVAPAAVAAPPSAAGAGRVAITATEDAWYRVSGFDPAVGRVVTVKTGVLAKGERYDVPATPGLRLWTGRAGALRLTVDGRPVPPLGGPVETVKNVSLDPADVLARRSSVATPPAKAATTGNRQ